MHKTTPVIRQQIVERYTGGEGNAVLARSLGLSPATIQRILKARGVPLRNYSHNQNAVAEFWDRIDQSGGPEACWPWRGAGKGYGQLKVWGRHWGSHCLALHLHEHGNNKAALSEEAPPGHVLHTCDNRPCCNPRHLYRGDHAQNMADRQRRQRTAKGERVASSKITEADVRAIRTAPGTLAAIGARYGLSKSTVSSIKRRLSWQHVD